MALDDGIVVLPYTDEMLTLLSVLPRHLSSGITLLTDEAALVSI